VEKRKYLRLVDANLNRCREGLRVIEDTARFVLGRDREYRELRMLRHRLERLTRAIYPGLLAVRDATSDAGRRIPEGGRDDLAGVVSANFRRVEESLRVLEEYSKLISPAAAPALKAMRYRAYVLEKKFHAEQD
jgi:thiamine-phosphate pyrophosphorylase